MRSVSGVRPPFPVGSLVSVGREALLWSEDMRRVVSVVPAGGVGVVLGRFGRRCLLLVGGRVGWMLSAGGVEALS